MESEVKSNVENAQKKQKLYYDRKHAAGDLFTVGSLVLKKDFRRKKRKGGKMDYRWQGPFVITTVLGKGLYALKEKDGNQVIQWCMCLYICVSSFNCDFFLFTGSCACEWISFEEVLPNSASSS